MCVSARYEWKACASITATRHTINIKYLLSFWQRWKYIYTLFESNMIQFDSNDFGGLGVKSTLQKLSQLIKCGTGHLCIESSWRLNSFLTLRADLTHLVISCAIPVLWINGGLWPSVLSVLYLSWGLILKSLGCECIVSWYHNTVIL